MTNWTTIPKKLQDMIKGYGLALWGGAYWGGIKWSITSKSDTTWTKQEKVT